MFAPRVVYGVDFSGARLAGEHTWLARLEPVEEAPQPEQATAYEPRGSGASVVAERGAVYRTAPP